MNSRSLAATTLIFLVVSLAFTHPIFKNLYYAGRQDWSINHMYLGLQRESILNYHQLPFWNPYHCGGYIMLGFPESSVLSPFFVFILAFGELLGVKIKILVFYVFGLFGMLLLSRKLGLSVLSAYYASFVFVLSTMVSVAVSTGMHAYTTIFLIPWIFYFFLKSYEKRVHVVPATFFLTLIYFEGEPYWFLYTFIFLGAYVSLDAMSQRRVDGLEILASVVVLCFLLGAVKIIPTIDWYMEHPRGESILDYSGYSLTSFYHAMLDRNQAYFDARNFNADSWGLFEGMSHGWDENAMYVGYIPLIMYLLGVILCRKQKKMILLSLIFLWFSFGQRLTILGFSPYGILQSLPLFGSLRVATRFRTYFLLCLSIVSGAMLSTLEPNKLGSKRTRNIKSALAYAIFLLVVLDLVFVGVRTYETAFTRKVVDVDKPLADYLLSMSMPQTSPDRTAAFTQHTGTKEDVYVMYRMNKGVVDSPISMNCIYDEGHINHATPRESAEYEGEVYLADSEGEAKITYFSPNRIEVEVYSKTEGTLVLNQNYDKNWRVSGAVGGRADSFNGLVSTRIPGGENSISFFYLPVSLIAGAIISFFMAAFMVSILIKNKAG
ncbi:MAG: hypothetical protein ABH834_01465 [Candidatus Altiarchaeota archaeon]